jgi:hypothetical protein
LAASIAFAVIGLGSEHAKAQAVGQNPASATSQDHGVDSRTTAYRDCHNDSTELLYREHPMCQPGMAPLRPPSAAEPCPYSGGDRRAEIMRRSAECMRAKGYK